jgi:Trypsin-co-occurring domain 1
MLLQETLPQGGTIYVEVDGDPADEDLTEVYGNLETREGLSERITKASRPMFAAALDLIDSCAKAVVERITEMSSERPDELEMQLAVKLDTKVGAKIVELAGGAQMQVVLRWRK